MSTMYERILKLKEERDDAKYHLTYEVLERSR